MALASGMSRQVSKVGFMDVSNVLTSDYHQPCHFVPYFEFLYSELLYLDCRASVTQKVYAVVWMLITQTCIQLIMLPDPDDLTEYKTPDVELATYLF